MKIYQLLAICLAVVLNCYSVTAAAGSISDTYSSGDVLTADTLNNIKTAVNDNNNASRFYGDGSAGALTISADTDWNTAPPTSDNLNFTNVVIDAGSTLTIPAGTIIRCTGTFTNYGTIIVSDAGNRGYFYSGYISYGKSDARRIPGEGDSSTSMGTYLYGGGGGKGIARAVAASSFNELKIGGGAGSGGTALDGISSGGGLIKIYCQGAIANENAITANGGHGGNSGGGVTNGGGGGGIIILASSTSITNTGSISAVGGKGSDASPYAGASGGGGGGIIILNAPAITSSNSTLFVNGGAAGTSGVTISTSYTISAGGGGGASGGDGGNGGAISRTNITQSAANGQDGYVLRITANPASMMQ